MNNSVKLSIVIPCFNEAENISILLRKFQEVIKTFKDEIEVIIIDGASTDGTTEILKKAIHNISSKSFKLVTMESQNGYGYDISYGLNIAKGKVLCWSHADLQTDPEDIIKAYNLFHEQEQEVIVKGKRKKRPLLDTLFTFGMQIFAWLKLGVYIDDINAQPKMFSKKFFNQYIKEKAPHDFSLDLFLLYTAKKQKLKIIDFPVLFKKRLYGEAKGGGGGWKNKIKLIKRTFYYISKLKRDHRGYTW